MAPDMHSSEPASRSVPARLRSGSAQPLLCEPDDFAHRFVFNSAARRSANPAPGTACRFDRHITQASK